MVSLVNLSILSISAQVCRHYICILFSGTNNRIAKNKDTIFRILFMQDNNRCGLVNQFLKASISSPLQLEWDIKYLA